MEGIEIRLAEANDIGKLIEVGKDLFDHPIRSETANEFFKDPRHHMVIALRHKEVIGFASGFHYIHPDKDPQFFVNEVSVLLEYQNQGIGRSVTESLVKHATTLGCVEAWIATEVSNKAARSAYLNAGAKEDEQKAVVLFWENLY